MQLLDTLTINSDGDARRLELWEGDLTAMPPGITPDILVVSAFPDDYQPVAGTLIGALHAKGVEVSALAKDKLVDLRDTCSCWLSKEIHACSEGIRFKHILCFEPFVHGEPEEIVGDIFRALAPFVCGDPPITDIAMPLVSSGDAGVPVAVMLEALFNAAVGWLEHGLPVKRLRIVTKSPLRAAEMRGAFAILKRCYQRRTVPGRVAPQYDVFVSYCQADSPDADFVVNELKRQQPATRVFLDRLELQPGMAWQTKIFQAIDDAHKVLALYSPAYLKSKACQEEYNIARVLHCRAASGILYPVFLYSADLPPYMAEWQYLDCREGDRDRLRIACTRLLAALAASTSHAWVVDGGSR